MRGGQWGLRQVSLCCALPHIHLVRVTQRGLQGPLDTAAHLGHADTWTRLQTPRSRGHMDTSADSHGHMDTRTHLQTAMVTWTRLQIPRSRGHIDMDTDTTVT